MTKLTAHVRNQISADNATNKVVTLPNLLSLLRILLIPLAIYFFSTYHDIAVIVVIVICSVSDFFDGYIARKFQQVTKIGKILDPVADRLLIFVTLIMLTIRGFLPVWFILAVLVRETMLFFQYFQLVTNGRDPLPVRLVGKIGAAGLMLGMPLLFLTTSPEIRHTLNYLIQVDNLLNILSATSFGLLLISLIIYWRAGVLYCRDSARILATEPNKLRIILSAFITLFVVILVIVAVFVVFPNTWRFW